MTVENVFITPNLWLGDRKGREVVGNIYLSAFTKICHKMLTLLFVAHNKNASDAEDMRTESTH